MNDALYARIAGFGYLVIFVLAIFANFAVFEAVYVPGDEAQTLLNIEANQYFSLGVLCFLIVGFVDIVIAWALFRLFKHELSLLAMILRVSNALLLIGATAFLALKDAETFHLIWMFALFLFGAHLILVAIMLGRKWYERVLSVLLVLAGLAYILDTAALLVLANYEVFAGAILGVVASVGIIGELGFVIWVFWRGFRKHA